MGAPEKIAKHPLPVPAFWAAVAFAAGIFAAAQSGIHLPFWFVGSAISGLAAVLFHLRSKNAAANFSALILLTGLGALRYSAATEVVAGRSVANFAGLNKRMVLAGRVCELPDIKPNRTRIFLDQVEVGWKSKIELDGKILLSIGQPVSNFGLEDRIRFVSFLDSLWPPANPGALDFARSMRIRGVEGTVFLKDAKGIFLLAQSSGGWRRRLAEARDFVERRLTEGLPAKTAGVVKGFVLGDTRDIEPSTYGLFKKTGTLHLLAVSGANVAWVALLPILLLKLFYLPLRWRYLTALVMVGVFVLLTDLQASVLRAALMFTFWTASKIIYREVSGLQSLGLSGLFLLLINPLWFFDIGFQLSYIAVFALVFSFSKPGAEKNRFGRYASWIFLNNFRSSAAVFLLITPLLAYYFNTVAWASLLANVAVIPLAGLITWVSLFSFGFSFFAAPDFLSILQTKLFSLLFTVQFFFGGRPQLYLRLPHPSALESLSLTLAGFGLFLVLFKPDLRKLGVYAFLLGWLPVVWREGSSGGASLSVLEAKGEMVAVLAWPGQTVVIGGGRVEEKTNTPRQVLEPFLAYLGKDEIDGYLSLRFDSSGRDASEEIAKKFRPDFVGWPTVGRRSGETVGSTDIRFEYLLAAGDSVPFALRLKKGGFAFLFIPQSTSSRALRWDSLLVGPTVLVTPLEVAQAESLSAQTTMKAVVSTRREFRLPLTPPDKLFFTFKDGAVTFRENKKGWTAQTHLSQRWLVLLKH